MSFSLFEISLRLATTKISILLSVTDLPAVLGWRKRDVLAIIISAMHHHGPDNTAHLVDHAHTGLIVMTLIDCDKIMHPGNGFVLLPILLKMSEKRMRSLNH